MQCTAQSASEGEVWDASGNAFNGLPYCMWVTSDKFTSF